MHSACLVQDLLGEGGQAEVYRARIGNLDYALKWYRHEYLHADPRLWERLKEAINAGSPTEQFLWPFDLASLPGVSAYGGYIMPLNPPEYVSLVDLLRRKCEPTFHSLANVGFQLAHSFFRLHTLGLCYRDINFGNIFFHPATGDIRIGDTDNVDVNRRRGGIMGTWGFMAPEVGRREAEPSAMTDRFSLAVLLFYIFMLGHPLKGRLETQVSFEADDPDGARRLCALRPLFVFDPKDDSNRPLSGLHDAVLNFWAIYPQSLRDLFTRSFTSGLNDPDARVMENEWRREMCRLRDSILYCPHCGAENFFDIDLVRQNLELRACWACSGRVAAPPRIRVGSAGRELAHLVMLRPGAQLFPHHLESDPYNFVAPLAEVTGAPLSLRNLSGRTWSCRSAGGQLSQVPPGTALALRNGCSIHFGGSEGVVRM